MIRRLLAPLILLLVSLAAVAPSYGATTLLPNGEQCFQNGNGPLSNGSVNMFQPGTTIPKTTWKDSGQVTANVQPIQLDSNGCAVIYGVGAYRQMVYDGPVVNNAVSGNLVFDQLTTDTSAFNSTFWAGLAGGTPNAITIVDAGFNATDGSVINFTSIATNTGATTINPSSFGAITVLKDTTAGPVALTGGEIIQNNPISVVYRASDNAFHLLNPPIQSASGSTAPLCGAYGYQATNNAGSPNTKIDITATRAVMVSATGQVINRGSVSVTINTAVNGANGLDTGSLTLNSVYYFYLIDNGSAPAGLISLSSTSPTLPTNYTYVCRVGAIVTDSSSHVFGFIQSGANTALTSASLAVITATAGNCNTGTFASFAVTNAPVTANQIVGGMLQGSASRIGIGASSTVSVITTNVNGNAATFSIPVLSQTIWYCNGSTSNSINIDGWVDSANVN